MYPLRFGYILISMSFFLTSGQTSNEIQVDYAKVMEHVMRGFEFCGAMDNLDADLPKISPRNKKQLPKVFRKNVNYAFFHRQPISIDEICNQVLPKRLKREGFTIKGPDVIAVQRIKGKDSWFFFINFRSQSVKGIINTFPALSVEDDKKLSEAWWPQVFVVEFSDLEK